VGSKKECNKRLKLTARLNLQPDDGFVIKLGRKQGLGASEGSAVAAPARSHQCGQQAGSIAVDLKDGSREHRSPST
jgi:hypothetical protein